MLVLFSFFGFFFVGAPFFCISKVRGLSRLILERFDDRLSQEFLNQLDESTWIIFGWYLFIPGFLFSFWRTKKKVLRILEHLGFE